MLTRRYENAHGGHYSGDAALRPTDRIVGLEMGATTTSPPLELRELVVRVKILGASIRPAPRRKMPVKTAMPFRLLPERDESHAEHNESH